MKAEGKEQRRAGDAERKEHVGITAEKNDRGSTRNYNLLIRSQTRYHYATRPVETLDQVAFTNLLHLYLG